MFSPPANKMLLESTEECFAHICPMLAEHHPLCTKRAFLSTGPLGTTTFVPVAANVRQMTARGNHLHMLTCICSPAGLRLEVLGKARRTGDLLIERGGICWPKMKHLKIE